MPHPFALRLILLLALVACARPSVSEAKSPDNGGFGHAQIVVSTAKGERYLLNVEVARTHAQHELGLMYRRSLAQDAGMIFLFDKPSVQTFWMKNTLIPLDMIFIGEDGRVVGIVADATPETETVRSVEMPSKYVLEMNAGWAALKGVHVGAQVDLGDAIASH